MKNIKKIALALTLTTLFTSVGTSMAQAATLNTQGGNKTNFTQVDYSRKAKIEKLKKELKAKGFEIVAIDEEAALMLKKDNRKPINVNSVDELDQICKKLDEQKVSKPTKGLLNTNQLSENKTTSPLLASLTTYHGTGTASEYAWLIVGGTFAWKNISFSFDYTWYGLAGCYIIPSGSTITNINSYLSGIYVVDWKQTSSSYNIQNTGRKVDFTVNGNYTFGTIILGVPCKVTKAGVWNLTSDDISSYI